MALFEVFIPGREAGMPNVTLTLEAPNWIGALRSGLKSIGEGQEAIANVMCDIKEDNSIHVTDVATRRVFRLREVQPGQKPKPADPMESGAVPSGARDARDGPRPISLPDGNPVDGDTVKNERPPDMMTQAPKTLIEFPVPKFDPPPQKPSPALIVAPPAVAPEHSVPWTKMPAPGAPAADGAGKIPDPRKMVSPASSTSVTLTAPAPAPASIPGVPSRLTPAPVTAMTSTSAPADAPTPFSRATPIRGVQAPPPAALSKPSPAAPSPASASAPSPTPSMSSSSMSSSSVPQSPSSPITTAMKPPPAAKPAPSPVSSPLVARDPAPISASANDEPDTIQTEPMRPPASSDVELTERVDRTKTAPGKAASTPMSTSMPTPRGVPAPAPKRPSGQFAEAPQPKSREVTKPNPQTDPKIGRSEKPKPSPAVQDAIAAVFDATQDLYMETTLSSQHIADKLLDIALTHIPAEAGTFYLADVNGHALTFAAVRGPKADALKRSGMTVPVGQGIIGFCAQEGVCLAVSDIQKDPRFLASIAKSINYQPKDTLCASAEKDGRLWGALQLINSTSGFDAAHMEVLRFIGLTAAAMLERASDAG